ncbi:MAG TPA: 2-oxoglutarate dehydrogenase complex dihydrolipoyllysine-residue succinyltransferase [Gammaproteobacteria bacterium]|nr:2-oxoglutarate dehydrogenase complex dihydrolipoyllysine-residue succinyltransferase [Gammaproteobacteria bacterium]
MAIEVKVPLLPESISNATVATWYKKAGDTVKRDENIVDLETDKVMLEVPSPTDGILKEIIKATGSTVQAQEVIATIEAVIATKPTMPGTVEPPKASSLVQQAVSPTKQTGSSSTSTILPLSPSVRRVVAEHDVDVSQVAGTGKGGRITKENVFAAMSTTATPSAASVDTSMMGARPEKRVPMTRMRARIAERLLEVTQNTAMLTTFNEINMAQVIDIRHRHRERFEKTYHVRLGFMSFFIRACVEALKHSPIVNASMDGNDILYHGYYDIGVAVSTDRGLVVPVLRDVDKMTTAEIEAKISEYAGKARDGKLTLEEMRGGTFTITNGGVFGSLMATPLLNAPQCAILGMHQIQERPIAENGQVVIRPMMYVALSYDHRLVDGKESIIFLVNIKELLEDPARLILEV